MNKVKPSSVFRILSIIYIFIACNSYGQTSIQTAGTYVWNASQSPKEFSGKLQLSFVSEGQGFLNYGTVLAGGGYHPAQDGGAFQLYFPYSEIYGGTAPRIRLGRYNNQGWGDWQVFYTSANSNNNQSDWTTRKLVVHDKVGIGTADPTEKLSVNGNIRAKEIKVETANWPDYVFQDGYEAMSLPEIELFIKQNGHLPEIPSASEVEKEGISLGEMNKLLLKKIEELTLLLIEKNREIAHQGKEITEMKDSIKQVKNWIEKND